MSNPIAVSPEQFIFSHNSELKTDSFKVAEAFGRLHKNVIKSIESVDCSEQFASANFLAQAKQVKIGNNATREDKYYEMTKDGFMFLVMGFNGKKAAVIKEAYINAFNLMHDKLFPQTPKSPFITDNEALQFRKSLEAICKGDRTMYSKLYNKVYDYFGITSYKNIPAGKLQQAAQISGVNLVVVKKPELLPVQESIKGELVDNKPLTDDDRYSVKHFKEVMALNQHEFIDMKANIVIPKSEVGDLTLKGLMARIGQ